MPNRSDVETRAGRLDTLVAELKAEHARLTTEAEGVRVRLDTAAQELADARAWIALDTKFTENKQDDIFAAEPAPK